MNPLEAFIKGLKYEKKPEDQPKPAPQPQPQQPQQPSPPAGTNQPQESDFERGVRAIRENRDRIEKPNFAQGGTIPGTPPANPGVDNKTINARSGEFVVPEPVVRYYGEKFFNDLIESVSGQSMPGQQPEPQEPNPFTMMSMDEGD